MAAYIKMPVVVVDSISLYSDLQLTISNTAANATTVTTTTIITFLFIIAATFQGELNH